MGEQCTQANIVLQSPRGETGALEDQVQPVIDRTESPLRPGLSPELPELDRQLIQGKELVPKPGRLMVV